MPLNKVKGNMYPWVSHTHTHLSGECPHQCVYCYVRALERRFKHGKYTGPIELVKGELDVDYGSGRTIFVEHCNDLFAEEVPSGSLFKILEHCGRYPDNTYVFQTKNPERMLQWLNSLPPKRLLGCTIETTDSNAAAMASKALAPSLRYSSMADISRNGEHTFITVEPILKGDMKLLAQWLADIRPEFANVGADSKGTNLDGLEPSGDDVRLLLSELDARGVEVKQKSNLERLLKGS